MPEGPSIVILKEQAAKSSGKRIREVSGNSRQDLQRMHGQQVLALCSWGKPFLLAFDGFAMRVHFLLFGSYRIDDPKEGVAPRLRLRFDNGQLDLYACSLRYVEGDLDDTYDWSVDVMADAWDPAQARRRLRERPRPTRCSTRTCSPGSATSSRTKSCSGSGCIRKARSARCRRASSANW